MKKILSFASLLLALSFFTISPLYAAAHEKKVEDTTKDASADATDPEQKAEDATKDTTTDAIDHNENKEAEDEEPDCD